MRILAPLSCVHRYLWPLPSLFCRLGVYPQSPNTPYEWTLAKLLASFKPHASPIWESCLVVLLGVFDSFGGMVGWSNVSTSSFGC